MMKKMMHMDMKMVGETGFEPATSSSQSWHSTKLSYSPTMFLYVSFGFGGAEGI